MAEGFDLNPARQLPCTRLHTRRAASRGLTSPAIASEQTAPRALSKENDATRRTAAQRFKYTPREPLDRGRQCTGLGDSCFLRGHDEHTARRFVSQRSHRQEVAGRLFIEGAAEQIALDFVAAVLREKIEL